MKGCLFNLLFLFTFCLVNGQEPGQVQDVKGPRELIHLHVNKTTFLQGERLWFKAYVRDQNSKLPSLRTTNLHLAIYDEAGTEIKRKLFYVDNGMANGDVAIDSSFTKENYTLLAWTNYMRNFKELAPFRQQIRLIKNTDNVDVTVKPKVHISIYPEGGALITGAYNNMGVLVNDAYGKAIASNNLELVDGQGNLVRSAISTNTFGMGKTGIVVEEGKRYYLQLRQQDGDLVRQQLPMAIPHKIGLQIDNNGEDKVLCTLLANEGTFRAKETLNYSLAVYQDEFIHFEDIEIDQEEPVIALSRKSLPFGVLTAVLFDESLEPIAHRMFFNHRNDQKPWVQLEIDHCRTDFGDSLQLDIILPKGMQDLAQVSMTVLPNGTKAYRPNNTMVSSMLLKPYVNKMMEEAYFFNGTNRKKRFELDTRLLVAGWGRYDWDSRRLKQLRTNFAMESGIPISGRILDADLVKEKQVVLFTDVSRAFVFQELFENKKFTAKINAFSGDSVGIAIIDNQGKLRKPKAEIWFTKPVPLQDDGLRWLHMEHISIIPPKQELSDIFMPMKLDEGVIALDEVVVMERRARENKFQISANTEGRVIRDVDIQRTPSIITYIRRLGFMSRANNGRVGFYVNRYPYPTAPVVLNGMAASPGEIIGMPLSRAKVITYNKSTTEPFISIILNDSYVAPENRNKFIKFFIEKGYARPERYLQPNYPNYDNVFFTSYGAIDWQPNILVDSEVPTSVKIPLHSQEGIQLYMEGTTHYGQLIAVQRTIDVKKTPF